MQGEVLLDAFLERNIHFFVAMFLLFVSSLFYYFIQFLLKVPSGFFPSGSGSVPLSSVMI